MALPTIPSCWNYRRPPVEEQLSRIRQQHQQFQEQWNSASTYFKNQTVKNNIRSSLMSENSYKKSMDAYSTLEEKNKKSTALHKRRQKLQKLLCKEQSTYEAELRRLSIGNYSRLQDMKEKSEELKSSREEKRQQLAAEKLYEHWKENNPELRLVESDLHRQHVKEVWGDQTQRKEEIKKNESLEDQKFANQYEEARMKAMENIRKKEEQRIREEKETARVLKQQMEDLKGREEAAAALRKEEEDIMKEQWQLDKIQEERKKVEEQRKHTQLQRFLYHQYKAQLRRRAHQIQEELEFDHQILKRLQEKEQMDAAVQSARRQQAKADVEWMKKVLEEQIKVEKQREAEFDLVYREEARRVWEQREEEWKKERMAREKLMKEVLEERKDQIFERAERNRYQQEELIREREELLSNLEEVQKTSRREKAEEEKRRQMRQEEIEGQMTERKLRNETHRKVEEEELRREKEGNEEHERITKEEVMRMREEGFKTKRRSRSSRVAWD